MMALRALPPACGEPGTEIAQRFLASAFDSVDAVLGNLDALRQQRRQAGGDIRGRLTSNEEDLLRAAVVFTGAGLDSTLKQLIRDTLPRLLNSSEQAHEKFERFAEDQLATAEIANPKMLARYLTSRSPRARLIEDYVFELTGSSLQSAEEMQKVAGALGIDDPQVRQQIGNLRPLFVARNEISHELDLQRPEQPGDRTRRTRRIGATTSLCDDGLEVCQLVVNAVGALLAN